MNRLIFESFIACPQDFSVAMLGFGRANRAVAEWLLGKGGTATVYADTPVAQAYREQYAARGLRFYESEMPDDLPEQVLVRSPGIRPDAKPIRAALARGACLTSETELLLALTQATPLGITGSDGKTTTATLAAALLRAAGHRTWLGGNNGTPLLARVEEMKKGDLLVLELSSFQLMTLACPLPRAVITNISPNHLNWHTDMSEYVAAKCRIFGGDTHLVLNADNETTAALAASRAEHTCLFSARREWDDLPAAGRAYACGQQVTVEEGSVKYTFDCLTAFSLPGTHNLENLLAALALTAPYLTHEAPTHALTDFRGVAHRLEYVDTVGGVAYYNSSIDTSPSRTVAALSALSAHPVVILGGRGKGVSFAPLTAVLAKSVKAACLYGEAAPEIAAVLPQGLPFVQIKSFDEAFSAAVAFAKEGDTVLLSPACTAFGEFRDYEARGKHFCALVKKLNSERIKGHWNSRRSSPPQPL